ncbi:MAG: hypothetical protein IKR18_10430, partial [Bacteroidaceae bacterium]|nr:hypothetical protein [Bacteroidaceae bacterium]
PIESLDLTKCTKLQTLDASCTADHSGALTTLDLSKNTALKNLKLNYNQLEVLDLTSNLNINSVYALNNKLANIVLPAELPSCTYLSLNNNLLTSFDGSCLKAMTKSKGSILLSNNLLTSVTNLTAKSVNISNNKFKISTVPATPNVGTLTYAPQKAVEVTDNVTTKLDLSSEYDEGNTTYTLYVGTEAAAPEAYSVENGVISFHQAVENAYIAMTSSRLTNFKLSNALKTTVFSVSEAASIGSVETERADAPKFNLAGQLVRSAKGIVVVKGKKYLAK